MRVKLPRGPPLYFLCGLLSAEWGEVNTETVHSLSAEQLHKRPRVSHRNGPTHSGDASMGFVVVMERGRQRPDLEWLLPWRPLQWAKSSCRQSADALWVNPFKHDLLPYLFIFTFDWRESLLWVHKLPPPFCVHRACAGRQLFASHFTWFVIFMYADI